MEAICPKCTSVGQEGNFCDNCGHQLRPVPPDGDGAAADTTAPSRDVIHVPAGERYMVRYGDVATGGTGPATITVRD